jgi:hypothetical protein
MEAQKKPVVTSHAHEELQIELEEKIRNRAYELYEGRGRQDGHHIEDWLEAEAELNAQRSRTVAA